MLVTLCVKAQDSLAHIRKPVLLFLLERSQKASYYEVEINSLVAELNLQSEQAVEYKKIIANYQQDSIKSAEIIQNFEASTINWESSFNDMKEEYQSQIKLLNRKWIIRGVIILGVFVAIEVIRQ